MYETLSVEQVGKLVGKLPVEGTVLPRKTFFKKVEKFTVKAEFAGLPVSFYPNYKCLGPFGDEQPVEFCGLTVVLYDLPDTRIQESEQIQKGGDLNALLVDLKLKLDEQCRHEGAVEISAAEAREAGVTHFGNCFHVYRCPKCKAVYGEDTSG